MSIRQDVTAYLAMRRTMGFKVEGLSKLLRSFVMFCEARGVEQVRNDVALEWATSAIKVPVNDALFARRMDAVRIFARHQHALDPATQIPAEEVCNRRYQPREPNIFSQAQILALLNATAVLSPQFKALTWRTLIGLLATTGMRPGEACRLSIDDVDLDDGVIRVVEAKFGKSRLVFIHSTTVQALDRYLQVRRPWTTAASSVSSTVFLNTRHRALDPGTLSKTFKEVTDVAGISTTPGHRPPRLHDLRHTFAVTTLLDWYRDGDDVQARLPLLSTWLGHVDPASTYWYLRAIPELLGHAARRLEARDNTLTTEATS
ncbi:tyrosine-type recombinase/integrase [Myceligenerans halotolerans]